ncbi:alpha/beta hydrolase [Pseudomonas sp. dw_358]|uniref:alpha/beta hydrolase n=1 Tax=Pseudomonas sp. dw_358 TaxID=2720083 RepID=UPI001BD627B1|nr:alpha/beta hydrolase [Pseudomonas sp. dw_358]
MPTLALRRRSWLMLVMATLIAVGLPYGCSRLHLKERELLFNIEPGTASWFDGLPVGVQELNIPVQSLSNFKQSLHAWWWPASRADAPAVLYLHGTRWNLTAQLRRIGELHDMGFAVLAIDYRGFGQSPGDLPSERTVYEDAQAGWTQLLKFQPDARKRYIYGHSLGGAIAVDLAERIAKDPVQNRAAGLVIESTFTDLGSVAAAVIHTSLPVRWILSEKFDSIDKIADIDMPVLIVHGADDPYVPSRFSRELYAAAIEPKRLLLVPGANHNNSMQLGNRAYTQALREVFNLGPAVGVR